jgi:hypothetical protein
VPARTGRICRRIGWLHRNDFVVVIHHADYAQPGLTARDRLTPHEVWCSSAILLIPDPKMEDRGQVALKLDKR